jgi:hypothetical protein
MRVRHIKNPAVAAVYATTFMLIYKYFLNPVFEYMHYYWIERGFLTLLSAITICVIPTLFYRGLKSISSFIAILTYAICYVPTVIVLQVALDRDLLEIFSVQLAVMIGMSMFFLADRIVPGRFLTAVKTPLPMRVVDAVTLVFTAFVAYAYSGNMRLVNFEDVYDLREAASEAQVNVLVGYMEMWLTYCLYPLYLAIGITNRRWTYFVLGSLGCLMIYMATGAKAGLLTPVIVICVFLLIRMRGDFFRNCLLALSGISLCLLVLGTADNLIANWATSLLFNRTLGSGGWASYIYYEFFTANRLTYFSHVNIINHLVGGYPYGTLSLGQVIGQYIGASNANFNAHFWASDGIAALGVPGIYVISILVSLYLTLLNLLTTRLNLRFLCVWLTGFVLGMLNLPFLTTLLSGGGLLIVLLLMFVRIPEAQTSSHPTLRTPRLRLGLAQA